MREPDAASMARDVERGQEVERGAIAAHDAAEQLIRADTIERRVGPHDGRSGGDQAC